MDDNTCPNCRFWEHGVYPARCRRRAPAPVVHLKEGPDKDEILNVYWPITTATDWCGEFEPREKD